MAAARIARFGFVAEYLTPSPAYDEFEEFLRLEFSKRAPGWEAGFGKVSRYDPHGNRWNYGFLLEGEVPDARSRTDAGRRVRKLATELGSALAAAHQNPGKFLPVPQIWVWQIA